MTMSATLGFAPEWNQFRRWWITVAVLLALLLLLLWFAGYGPGGAACKRAMLAGAACETTLNKPAAPAPAVAAPAAAPVVAAAAPAAVAAAAAPPAAKIYFALDKAVVPADTPDRLKAIVAYLKANPKAKAVVSGFHDPTGSLARNEELALNRARAVRTALERAGIKTERVMMQKPTATTGDGPDEEARRVEVAVRNE
jgi:outer membrane protein OmpA-like peptidoglycan-associated protein